jgi:hypothetical protein
MDLCPRFVVILLHGPANDITQFFGCLGHAASLDMS